MQDNYCPDSIILWYAHTIFKACMYMIRRALSLYLWGKESFIHKYMSTQEYMSLSETSLTNQRQTGFCPYKVDILL